MATRSSRDMGPSKDDHGQNIGPPSTALQREVTRRPHVEQKHHVTLDATQSSSYGPTPISIHDHGLQFLDVHHEGAFVSSPQDYQNAPADACRGLSVLNNGDEPVQPPAPVADLGEQIRKSLRPSCTDDDIGSRPFFLPIDQLNRIINIHSVRRFLERKLEDKDGSGIQDLVDYICGSHSTKFAARGSARRILAILLLENRPDTVKDIQDFLEAGVYDSDLPLARAYPDPNEKIFQLKRRTLPGPPDDSLSTELRFLDSWTQLELESFEHRQWEIHVPFFARSSVPHGTDEEPLFYKFHKQTILPWTSRGKPIKSPFSEVRKTRIHVAHLDHDLNVSQQGGNGFALKRINGEDEFDLEMKALRKIRRKAKNKKSLIAVLLSFKLSSDYFLMFPWAGGGNLLQMWTNKTSPEGDRSWSCWLAEQCAELADGLSGIHDAKLTLEEVPAALKTMTRNILPQQDDEQDFGRHGDIKPANILWFHDEENIYNHGVLKIADFGLTTFHREHTTKVPHKTLRGVTSTYQAPECDLVHPNAGEATLVSRKYDVWSLGCMYLEFAIWVLMGIDGVDDFREQRATELDTLRGWGFDSFHNFYIVQKSGNSEVWYVEVKKTVLQWIEMSKNHPKCTGWLFDFLTYISTHMLVVDPADRETSARIGKRLTQMYGDCIKADSVYCTEPLNNTRRSMRLERKRQRIA